ncbi:putative transcription factor & chromatin remodeling ARID family [Helianthus anomalus]
MNQKNEISGLTREDEIGIWEKESIIKFESDHEAYKIDYLNQYFKNLNLSSCEPDWNVMILQAMSLKEFQDCKALLEMLEDCEYVNKYKFYLEKIPIRPIPAYASDNRRVNLLELYMVIKREGGHRRVTENNLWAVVAKDMGLIIKTESS